MGGWRRAELKAGVYDEIVSARLDRQLAALGDAFDVHRAALKASEPIGAVLESLLADGVALALAALKADSGKGIALAEALLAVLRNHAPHAKAWIFHRASGFSTAFVGSSNLSHAAQTDGLEWNVRLTQSDQPALVAQMQETFDQYWADAHQFEQYDYRNEAAAARLRSALSAGLRDEPNDGQLVEVDPKDFQKPVMEELETARTLGRHRNLIVAATGTGKTVMAAMDYRTLREAEQVDTLLYVAHRREILEQARRMFRNVLQMRDFGELLCQGQRPGIGRHVFASHRVRSRREERPGVPALIDVLGEGRARERKFAEKELLPLLEAAVRLLQPLLDELVFVGGCATGLLVTDPAPREFRPTKDVDTITASTRTGPPVMDERFMPSTAEAARRSPRRHHP